jgi:hypothetical protein
MNHIRKTILASAILSTLLASSAIASTEGHKSVKVKVMTGINKYEADYGNDDQSVLQEEELYGYGIAIEYEFTPTIGMELRHYFGGEKKKFGEDVFAVEASLENASALMLTAKTPELFGLSIYIQAGPSLIKNSINGSDVSKKSIAYGGGVKYSVDETKSIFVDTIQFSKSEFSMDLGDDESPISGELKNRIISLGFMMKF